MNYEYRKLADLTRCYATTAMTVRGRLSYLFASELDDACYCFDAATLKRSTVWEHPGGTMAIIPLEGKDGEFLAVQNFKPKMLAPGTTIVHAVPGEESWQVKTLLQQGYIHRFDVLKGDKSYLVLCTIASFKSNYEDWSCPGKIWAGVLPEDLSQPIELHPIREGLTKNHGYCRLMWKGRASALVSSDEGVLVMTPPQFEGDEWHFEQLLDRPVSDIAMVDIDGDGEAELACIEPLHGDAFTINKKKGESWETVYRYEGDFQFGHVVWGGLLRGTPVFIGGARQGAGELFVVKAAGTDPVKFETTVIDKGKGPGNVFVVHGEDSDIILAANRESDHAALYIVRD